MAQAVSEAVGRVVQAIAGRTITHGDTMKLTAPRGAAC